MSDVAVGSNVVYLSESGREWPAVVTAIHPNGHKNPKGVTLPCVSLEFRNERNRLVRKKEVLPFGWAYWCSQTNFYRQVWKLIT
jgi:hypothetical protein